MQVDEMVALAEDFWERVGFREPFPRDLERVLVLSTPVFPVQLAGLPTTLTVPVLLAATFEALFADSVYEHDTEQPPLIETRFVKSR